MADEIVKQAEELHASKKVNEVFEILSKVIKIYIGSYS